MNRSFNFAGGAVEARQVHPSYDFFATSEHKPKPDAPVGQAKARAQEAAWGGWKADHARSNNLGGRR